jgi:hypothetical protein
MIAIAPKPADFIIHKRGYVAEAGDAGCVQVMRAEARASALARDTRKVGEANSLGYPTEPHQKL